VRLGKHSAPPRGILAGVRRTRQALAIACGMGNIATSATSQRPQQAQHLRHVQEELHGRRGPTRNEQQKKRNAFGTAFLQPE